MCTMPISYMKQSNMHADFWNTHCPIIKRNFLFALTRPLLCYEGNRNVRLNPAGKTVHPVQEELSKW